MIKRTLHFGNPAYLSTKMEQLEVRLDGQSKPRTLPIEDIGVVILDHPQITITQTLIAKLLENNVALITCNKIHHPVGLMLNLDGHTRQSKFFKYQLEAREPLKKQLWSQTIRSKILNQAAILRILGHDDLYLEDLALKVRSGDTDNCEAQAASYYWKILFHGSFTRQRYGIPPNNWLNYGYAILRAIVARSLVGSGLLPTLGIFHRNQYNAYCLADDMMEPYRPYVDHCVLEMIENFDIEEELTTEHKKSLLQIPVMDVMIGKKNRPLMIAVQETTASLALCFEGKQKNLKLPILQ